YDLAAQLRGLLDDPAMPAAARVNAARTLAELEGRIGRHQAAPDRGATVTLSQLSRDELIGELHRLRTLFELGLVRYPLVPVRLSLSSLREEGWSRLVPAAAPSGTGWSRRPHPPGLPPPWGSRRAPRSPD